MNITSDRLPNRYVHRPAAFPALSGFNRELKTGIAAARAHLQGEQ